MCGYEKNTFIQNVSLEKIVIQCDKLEAKCQEKKSLFRPS